MEVDRGHVFFQTYVSPDVYKFLGTSSRLTSGVSGFLMYIVSLPGLSRRLCCQQNPNLLKSSGKVFFGFSKVDLASKAEVLRQFFLLMIGFSSAHFAPGCCWL